MSENLISEDCMQDQTSIDPGSIVRVAHFFSKTRQDELDLVPGDLVTILECPEGGWCKGIKGIDTKNPTTGWFPIVISEKMDQFKNLENGPNDSNLESNNNGYKRSRSASVFGKVFGKSISIKSIIASDNKIRRTRSTSAPCSQQSLVFSIDLESVADSSLESLNRMNKTTEIPFIRTTELKKIDESKRPSSPSKLLKLKSTSSFSPAKEYMSLRELVDTEWHYLQDLYLIRVRFSSKLIQEL